jgi:conjugative transfer region protein (TIGR03750 family)
MRDERLADSVNAEPIVFMDCTGTEIVASALVSFVAGMMLGIIVGITIGKIMIGLIVGLIISLGFTYGLLHYLCAVRNKYYETWLKEKVFLYKLSSGFFGLTLINESHRFGRGARKVE